MRKDIIVLAICLYFSLCWATSIDPIPKQVFTYEFNGKANVNLNGESHPNAIFKITGQVEEEQTILPDFTHFGLFPSTSLIELVNSNKSFQTDKAQDYFNFLYVDSNENQNTISVGLVNGPRSLNTGFRRQLILRPGEFLPIKEPILQSISLTEFRNDTIFDDVFGGVRLISNKFGDILSFDLIDLTSFFLRPTIIFVDPDEEPSLPSDPDAIPEPSNLVLSFICLGGLLWIKIS